MILPILILVLLNGCATITGPGVSREEIIKAQEELQVKALGYQLKQLSRVNDIGYRLISSLPIEDLKQKPDTYLGIYVFDINKYFKQLYNLMQDEGVVVGVVIKNSPAEKAGVSAGDVLISINNIKLKDVIPISANKQTAFYRRDRPVSNIPKRKTGSCFCKNRFRCFKYTDRNSRHSRG